MQQQIHFVLQGKGGVGKSYVASLITQYLLSKNQPVLPIDTDPVNATLAGYEVFNARRLTLLSDGKIIERKFDELMEIIAHTDMNIVIDSGASTFIPLAYYLKENNAINMILGWDKKILVHTIITGGQAFLDTVNGFIALAEQMPPDVGIVVWLNEFFGDIVHNEKTFEQSKVYQNYHNRIYGIVRLPRYTASTFGQDVQAMLDRRLTFEEVAALPEFGLMAKSRLSRVKKSIFDQLDQIIPLDQITPTEA